MSTTYDIFNNIDKAYILNTLKQYIDDQILSESVINNVLESNDFDLTTKSFVKYVFDLISFAKRTEFQVAENNATRLDEIIKDSEAILNKYFSNNSIIGYYEDVLEDVLKNISNLLNKKLNIEKIRTTIVNILTSVYKEISEKRKAQFDETLKAFKEEATDLLSIEFTKKTEGLVKNIEKEVEKEIDKNKQLISKDIKDSIDLLLYKSVPEYMKSLNNIFDKNFRKYIESNFTNKTHQLQTFNKIKSVYDNIKTPFVYVSKFLKYVKENKGVDIGNHAKKSAKSKKWYHPFKNFKERIKKKFETSIHELRKGFLKRTRFIRKPKRFLQLKLGKLQRKLAGHKPTETLRKYGVLAFLVESIFKAFRKKNKNLILLGQMNFKPFKMLSVITNTLDEFIASVKEHAATIRNNLKIYFDQNVVESYNTRKKFNIFRRKKKKVGTEEEENYEMSLWDYIISIPLLYKQFKRMWNFMRKVGSFFRSIGRFIAKISVKIFTKGAEVLGRILVSIGKRMNWPKIIKLGEKMFEWGNTARRIAKGVKAGERGLKALDKARKSKNALKALQEIDNAEDALKAVREAKEVAEAAKDTKQAAKLAKQITELENGIEAARAMKNVATATEFLTKTATHMTAEAAKHIDDLAEVSQDLAVLVAANKGKVIEVGGRFFVSKSDDALKLTLKGVKTTSTAGKLVPLLDWGIDLGVGYLIAELDEKEMKAIFGTDEITWRQKHAFAIANAIAGADPLNEHNWDQGFWRGFFASTDVAGTLWKYTSTGAAIGSAVGTGAGATAGCGVLSLPGAGVGFLGGGFIGGCVGFITGVGVCLIGTPRIARAIDATFDFFDGNEEPEENFYEDIRELDEVVETVPGLHPPIVRKEFPGPAILQPPKTGDDLQNPLNMPPLLTPAQVSPISPEIERMKQEIMAEAINQVELAKAQGHLEMDSPILQDLKNRAATIRQIENLSMSPMTLKMLVQETDEQMNFSFITNPENEPINTDGTINDISKISIVSYCIDKLIASRPGTQFVPYSANGDGDTYATAAAKHWKKSDANRDATYQPFAPVPIMQN